VKTGERLSSVQAGSMHLKTGTATQQPEKFQQRLLDVQKQTQCS